MKMLRAVALVLIAAPAGAQQVRVTPSLPTSLGSPSAAAAVNLGLPMSAIPGGVSLPSVVPTVGLPSMLPELAPAAAPVGNQAPVLESLQGVLGERAGALPDGGQHSLNVGFDGLNKRLSVGAVPTGDSAGSAGSALSGLVARIEAEGQIKTDRRSGASYKVIEPVVEQTETSQSVWVVALKGTVNGAGDFAKTGIVAQRQSQSVTETPLSETDKRIQEVSSIAALEAGLDGKVTKAQGAEQDHTDVIKTLEYDPEDKQDEFQAELAAAQAATGASDIAGLIAKIEENGQPDIMAMLQGGLPSITLPISQEEGEDGTQKSLVAVLEFSLQGGKPVPSAVVLVRGSNKGQENPDGSGNTARQEQTVYKAGLTGLLLEAKFTGKDHSLTVKQGEKPADAASQSDFDGIVAKVAAGR